MYIEQICKIELRLGYLSLLKVDIYPLLCPSNFAVVNPEGAHSFSFLGGGRVWRTNSELRAVGYLLPLLVHSVCFRFNTISPIIGAGSCRMDITNVPRLMKFSEVGDMLFSCCFCHNIISLMIKIRENKNASRTSPS